MTDVDRRTFIAVSAGAAAAHLSEPAFAQPSTQDLTALTLKQASDLLRAGKVSPVELTRACLRRIDKHNAALNAYITVAGDQALAAAKAIEAERRTGRPRGPLHGVPIALKDNIDTAGIVTTGASELFRDRVPAEDAEVARRLKNAGTILLGKLNLHEFAHTSSPNSAAVGR